ncbi:hypothetical protein C2G38_2140538 [Gigaspora rosea]|uniref:Peptidase S1 domain-containing protein n=1 Tax=Gigaspora rosea TaxID=44941 RepID=A0A397VK38_9GLOM|nr:hypothetical protein C2G38_2140538 [Gigaspora rosea]
MNKKFSFYLLIALIAVINSHSSVISQKNDFRTPKRIKETTIFKNKHERNKENEERSKNKIYSRNIVMDPVLSKVNPNINFPIGLLIIDIDNDTEQTCTASVINTENGNIGLTSAHCLINDNGTTFDPKDISFSPGYDNQEGPLGTVNVEDFAIPSLHFLEPLIEDYALVKFAFTDPNGARLQDHTGGLGWRFDIRNNTLTNVFGYSGSDDWVNCTKDGYHLCEWQGNVQDEEVFYIIDGIDLGKGASGSPMIFQYNRTENLGYVYSVYKGLIENTYESFAPVLDEDIFIQLVLRLS